MRTLPSAGLAWLAAVAAFASLAPPRAALATKEYAKAEGKECSFCHVSDKGSGPRNPKGREYEANGHRFGVKSWSSPENEGKFLRASSALLSAWYAEAGRLLDELAKEETLPGGLALAEGTRDRFKMFKGPWLRSAKKLLEKGDRGLPNALSFLVKLESQFPGTDEGREATAILGGFTKDAAKAKLVAAARAQERVRLLVLEGRTEFHLGNAARARELLGAARADPLGKPLEKEIDEVLAEMPDGK